MFGRAFFGAVYYGPRYFGGVGQDATGGGYFGHRFFAEFYYGPRYFSPQGDGALPIDVTPPPSVFQLPPGPTGGGTPGKRKKQRKKREFLPSGVVRHIAPGRVQVEFPGISVTLDDPVSMELDDDELVALVLRLIEDDY